MTTDLASLIDQAAEAGKKHDFKQCVITHCSNVHAQTSPELLHSEVHPADQMLIHSLQHHQDADVALSQYFGISLQQHAAAMQIYRMFFDQDDRSVQVLDFACGYGRLLRLLSLSIPSSQLWASEIQPDAVEFVARAFDVQTISSHVDPEQFETGRQFDFIWVASLFSHLPAHLFHGWMHRLTSLLTPRGVLCFSVRSSDLLPSTHHLPESGILYFPTSEVTNLEADVYGTTYASEAYVVAAASSALGADHPCHRLSKALAHEQDLYVVCRDRDRSLRSLDAFRRGPWGWVDVRSLSAQGTLSLQGWAASLDDGAVQHVEINVDGVVHHVVPNIPRGDVRDAFSDPRLELSGWSFECSTVPYTPVRVIVSARSMRGELALLYIGTLSA